MLVVDPEALTLLANQAFHDINFFLRPKHLKQVAAILDDPEASENDRMVALTMLKNADVASAGLLPFCQDTGTSIIMGKKGQQVWTGGGDEAALSKGVYLAYTENNLRYSQNAALTCSTRRTPAPTCPRSSTCTPPMATRTNSSSSPKAAARRTRPSCIKRPAPCSIRRAS
jgi:fumarate hydratase class I